MATSALLFAIAHVYWPAAANLKSYERLRTQPTLVAQVRCERTGPQEFRVTLTRLPGGRMQVYQLHGDEWRLEARTLIWKGRAAGVGLHPGYRFERLAARNLHLPRPADAPAGPPMPASDGFGLADADEAGEDVWAQARTGERWTSQVEPGRVHSAWRPLADGARFDVWMSYDAAKLMARVEATAGNKAGAEAMR